MHRPMFPVDGPATEEQATAALQLTRRELTAMRDLVRELDLPADKIELAAEIYNTQLCGIVQAAHMQKDRERRKNARAKYEAAGGDARFARGQGYLSGPPSVLPFDMFDDED